MTKPKILIVDDEPYNVDYLEQELEELSYETVSATNGQEAIERVQSDSPDLILLDIMMPVMDGFKVLAILKDDPDTRNIPVIVISANTDLKSVVKGIELGAEDYLPKPFEPTLLKARISSSLEKKRLRDLQERYLQSLERELEIGRQIQQSFLPSELPTVDGWEIAAYFKAAREVSGDFYDAFLLPDGSLLCVIGDVCDKGVGAALFMTLFRSLIRATATSNFSWNGKNLIIFEPAKQLQHIIAFTNNYIFKTHNQTGMFATVFIGIINLSTNTLTYINCGHEPACWLREGYGITLLPPTGPMVGIIPEAKFTAEEILLENTDLILAFTDGVPDALNSENEFFGKDRLIGLLKKGKKNPSSLLEDIITHLQQFIGEAYPFDDMTLLAVGKCTR
jgi:serine phosphatase RsbU (regulator of sigma subunit)